MTFSCLLLPIFVCVYDSVACQLSLKSDVHWHSSLSFNESLDLYN